MQLSGHQRRPRLKAKDYAEYSEEAGFRRAWGEARAGTGPDSLGKSCRQCRQVAGLQTSCRVSSWLPGKEYTSRVTAGMEGGRREGSIRASLGLYQWGLSIKGPLSEGANICTGHNWFIQFSDYKASERGIIPAGQRKPRGRSGRKTSNMWEAIDESRGLFRQSRQGNSKTAS